MDVEFDPEKDEENRRKHGISLKRAEGFDMNAAAIETDIREDYGEERSMRLASSMDGFTR